MENIDSLLSILDDIFVRNGQELDNLAAQLEG